MDGFVGEIRMFAGDYAPQNWAICDGRLLSTADYNVLFMLLGTTYGGDGVNNFAVPDMRGRAPVCQGQGLNLSARVLAQRFGEETHVVSASEMPAHTHVLSSGGAATAEAPQGRLAGTAGYCLYTPVSATPEKMAADSLSPAGAGQAHQNMMPTLCINFIINLVGIFPTQD